MEKGREGDGEGVREGVGKRGSWEGREWRREGGT